MSTLTSRQQKQVRTQLLKHKVFLSVLHDCSKKRSQQSELKKHISGAKFAEQKVLLRVLELVALGHIALAHHSHKQRLVPFKEILRTVIKYRKVLETKAKKENLLDILNTLTPVLRFCLTPLFKVKGGKSTSSSSSNSRHSEEEQEQDYLTTVTTRESQSEQEEDEEETENNNNNNSRL